MNGKYDEAAAILDTWGRAEPGNPATGSFREWRAWHLFRSPHTSEFVSCRLTWLSAKSGVKMEASASALCPITAAEFAINKFDAEYGRDK